MSLAYRVHLANEYFAWHGPVCVCAGVARAIENIRQPVCVCVCVCVRVVRHK